jgi:hypothetical protein
VPGQAYSSKHYPWIPIFRILLILKRIITKIQILTVMAIRATRILKEAIIMTHLLAMMTTHLLAMMTTHLLAMMTTHLLAMMTTHLLAMMTTHLLAMMTQTTMRIRTAMIVKITHLPTQDHLHGSALWLVSFLHCSLHN